MSNEYMVTQKEAADFLHVSTKSISRYRKKGLPYKLVLNPVIGKQEVRFRYADLERWDEGRQLLATYARDGENPAKGEGKSRDPEDRPADHLANQGFLAELLAAYKEQIELLREQLEDMREQLGRRDRQIDDLMRLMVGLQLEYKPLPGKPGAAGPPTPILEETQGQPDLLKRRAAEELFESITLPESFPLAQPVEGEHAAIPQPQPVPVKKVFPREQLAASIVRLRRKGKSFDAIARGLNQIEVATLSGQPRWTVPEVMALLPALVNNDARTLGDEGAF